MKCAAEKYSRNELEISIARDDYHHQGGLPNNFLQALPAAEQAFRAVNTVRDEYLLDFHQCRRAEYPGQAGRILRTIGGSSSIWICIFRPMMRQSILRKNIRRLSGAMAITMSAICGISGRQVIPRLRHGQFARNWGSSGNLFRMSGSWLIFTGSTISCFPMAVWRMHLSAGMFRPANITTLMRSSKRSMDSHAERCGRMRLLSGTGRSITKGGFINQGSFCR